MGCVFRISILIPVLFFSLISIPAEATWQTRIIDAGGVNGYQTRVPDIAIDASGHHHVTYRDDSYGNQGIVYTTDSSGSWVSVRVSAPNTILADALSFGGPSIAVDSTNKAHISYFDQSRGVQYATNVSGNWVVSTLSSSTYQGILSSIAVDSSDKVHISYMDQTIGSGTARYIRYVTNVSGSWVTTNLDTISDGYSSLAIDSQDKIHIVYPGSQGFLKYATNVSGSWVNTTLSTASTGGRFSLAIDSTDTIHVIYFGATTVVGGIGSNYYYTTKTGGVWSTPILVVGLGANLSMAVDSSDKICVASMSGNLNYWNIVQYAFNPVLVSSTNSNGAPIQTYQFTTETIENTGYNFNQWAEYKVVSLALGANDIPVIAYSSYYQGGSIGLATTNGEWSTKVVDGRAHNAGKYGSLAVNTATNLPIMTYYSESSQDLYYYEPLNSMNDTNVASVRVSIDGIGNQGVSTSLAFDSATNMRHVVYFDSTGYNLKSALSSDGQTWTTGIRDSIGSVGRNPAIGLFGSDPLAVYRDISNQDLKFVEYSGAWAPPITLVSTGDVGLFSAVAIDDTNGDIHVTYDDATNQALKYKRYNNALNVWLVAVTIDSQVSQSSIALDSSGHAHIAYYKAGSNMDLKYATNVTGAWVSTTVDSTGDVGTYPSIALDSSDVVHISYRDATKRNLKYATRKPNLWSKKTVDNVYDTGEYTDIAIGNNDEVYIIYYDANAKDLRLATKSP